MNMMSRAVKLSVPLVNEYSRRSDSSANAPPSIDTRNTPKYLARDTIVVAGTQSLRSQICVQVPADEADEAVSACLTQLF